MHIPLCSQTITFRDETDCILIKMCLQLLGCVLLMYIETIFSKAEVIHIVENSANRLGKHWEAMQKK